MDDWQPRQIIVPKEVFNMEIRCDLKTKNVIYVYTNLINNHKYVPTERSLKLNNNLKVLTGMKFVRLND